MDKKFLLKFAFKNLSAHKLRSVLTLAGISIGVGAIVFLVGFAFGLERLVTEEITRGDAFKLVDVGVGNSLVVSLNQKSVDKIKGISFVKNIEVITNAGAKAKNGKSNMDISFYGTSPTYIDWLGFKLSAGKVFSDKKEAKEMLVSSKLKDFYGKKNDQDLLNQKIALNITLPKEIAGTSEAKTIENQEYTIVGVIKDDATPSGYIDWQDLVDMGAVNFSQAKVEISQKNQVTALRMQIENLGFKTQYVGDTVSQVSDIFNIFQIILGSFGMIALIVAALGMFNTLTISLLERTKEIALMKILGMKRKDINHIFLTEAIIFGIVGGCLGIGLGIGIGAITNSIINHFAIKSGADSVAIFYYPLWFFAVIAAFSLLVGIATGLYPAKRATKLNALDVLRYE